MNKKIAEYWRGFSREKIAEVDNCYMEVTGIKKVTVKERNSSNYAFFLQGMRMGEGLAILSMMEEGVKQ